VLTLLQLGHSGGQLSPADHRIIDRYLDRQHQNIYKMGLNPENRKAALYDELP